MNWVVRALMVDVVSVEMVAAAVDASVPAMAVIYGG